jgi:hypothetical protein
VEHISIVTCISASGACLTSDIVISQDSAPLHRALEVTGMQIGKHLILKRPDKPYVNSDLFENYTRTVFRHHLLATRQMYDFGEEDAVLLMDNCSPHVASAVLTLLSNARVRIVTFAPRTTQIFQILDLTLFGEHGLRELWDMDFHLENLSIRRRNARFGWVNRPNKTGLTAVSFSFCSPNRRYLGVKKCEKVELRTDSPYISIFTSHFHCSHLDSL